MKIGTGLLCPATNFHSAVFAASVDRSRAFSFEAFARRFRSHFIKHSQPTSQPAAASAAARNDRKSEKREPRTRLGVNLIFYSASSYLYALCSDKKGEAVLVAGTEAPRHLGCEIGDVPSRNPTGAPRCPPGESRVARNPDRKNSTRIQATNAAHKVVVVLVCGAERSASNRAALDTGYVRSFRVQVFPDGRTLLLQGGMDEWKVLDRWLLWGENGAVGKVEQGGSLDARFLTCGSRISRSRQVLARASHYRIFPIKHI